MEESTVQDHVIALCSKMNEYRRGDVYSDIDLRVQGKSFKCHRLVLGAASKYFHAMFTGKFKESTEFVVILEEIEADTFEGVLQFIYTGEVSINPTNLYGLFYASEYYVLPGLEKACVKYIQKCASPLVENVSRMYSFFRTTSKEEVADILDQNIFEHFDHFYRTSEFLKISVDDLRRILDEVVYYAPSNHDIFHKAIMKWTLYADSHSPEERRSCFDQLTENIDFKKLSRHYMKYMTRRHIEHGNSTVLNSSSNKDEITHYSEDGKSVVQPCLHAFANNMEVYDRHGIGRPVIQSEVFSCCEEISDEFKWVHSYSSKHRLPDFMRTVEVNNDLYCLSYTDWTMGEKQMESPSQKFISTSSISLLPKSYLTSPPLILNNFEMCKIDGKIYVYNRNALLNVIPSVKNSVSAPFDKEALARHAVFLYNTEIDEWLPVPPLKKTFANACMTSDEQILYLIGGTDSNKYVQAYDHRTSEWIALTPTSSVFERAACCVSRKNVYVSGGCQNPNKVEIYDPTAARWRNESDLKKGLQDHEMLVDEEDHCITYSKYLEPRRDNVFFIDHEWSSCMYDDLVNCTPIASFRPEVIHMTLFRPYGF